MRQGAGVPCYVRPALQRAARLATARARRCIFGGVHTRGRGGPLRGPYGLVGTPS